MLYKYGSTVRAVFPMWDYANSVRKTGQTTNLILEVYDPAGALVVTFNIAAGAITELGSSAVYICDVAGTYFTTTGAWVFVWYCTVAGCQNLLAEVIEISGIDLYTLTSTVPGTPIVANVCRVYEYVVLPEGQPVPSVSAQAKIISLPFNYSGVMFSGQVIEGTYDGAGTVYWDMPWTAEVEFTINDFGVRRTVTIPSVVNKRLADIT